MVAKQAPGLRPLRIIRSPGGDGVQHLGLPPVPERVPLHAVAPDWVGPTEDNGSDAPRGELHVALLAPDPATAAQWRKRARIVTPALWKGGEVHLHVVVMDPIKGDPEILLAMIDLGLIDSADAGAVGYPSGLGS